MNPFKGYRIRQEGNYWRAQRRYFGFWYFDFVLAWVSFERARADIVRDIKRRNPRVVWSDGMYTAHLDIYPAMKGWSDT